MEVDLLWVHSLHWLLFWGHKLLFCSLKDGFLCPPPSIDSYSGISSYYSAAWRLIPCRLPPSIDSYSGVISYYSAAWRLVYCRFFPFNDSYSRIISYYSAAWELVFCRVCCLFVLWPLNNSFSSYSGTISYYSAARSLRCVLLLLCTWKIYCCFFFYYYL